MTILGPSQRGRADPDTRPRWAPRSSRYTPGDERAVLRVDVLVEEQADWASNELRFLEVREALAFAHGLCDRWPIIRKIRVVPEGWPRGQAYSPGSEHPDWRAPA